MDGYGFIRKDGIHEMSIMERNMPKQNKDHYLTIMKSTVSIAKGGIMNRTTNAKKKNKHDKIDTDPGVIYEKNSFLPQDIVFFPKLRTEFNKNWVLGELNESKWSDDNVDKKESVYSCFAGSLFDDFLEYKQEHPSILNFLELFHMCGIIASEKDGVIFNKGFDGIENIKSIVGVTTRGILTVTNEACNVDYDFKNNKFVETRQDLKEGDHIEVFIPQFLFKEKDDEKINLNLNGWNKGVSPKYCDENRFPILYRKHDPNVYAILTANLLKDKYTAYKDKKKEECFKKWKELNKMYCMRRYWMGKAIIGTVKSDAKYGYPVEILYNFNGVFDNSTKPV